MATSLYGVLGWPVGHSASPAMMNAAFAHLGLDAVYVPFGVPPERLEQALTGLAALGARGVNVTIPHKQSVWQRMHERTEEAALVGAVNTVRFDAERGLMCGHNTDVGGWWMSIRDHVRTALQLRSDGAREARSPAGPVACPGVHRGQDGASPDHIASPLRMAVLGAGGAARAVVAAAALHLPHAQVSVVARRGEAAAELAAAFADRVRVGPAEWADRHRVIAEADVVVNTTPMGMWPREAESPVDDPSCFRPGQVVQDIVYRPLETRLMRQAKDRGAAVADGLSMLVHQGALALAFWLGADPPVAVMHEAALRFLAGSRLGVSGRDV